MATQQSEETNMNQNKTTDSKGKKDSPQEADFEVVDDEDKSNK